LTARGALWTYKQALFILIGETPTDHSIQFALFVLQQSHRQEMKLNWLETSMRMCAIRFGLNFPDAEL
jgi:hypothetical protein